MTHPGYATGLPDQARIIAGLVKDVAALKRVSATIRGGGGIIPIPLILDASSGFLLEGKDSGSSRIAIDYLGNISMYANDGATGVAGLYAGDTPALGSRLILTTKVSGARAFSAARASGQTAALGAFLDSDGTTVLSAIDAQGDFVTFADNGTTATAGIYAGSTPVVGYRAILSTETTATRGLGIKRQTGQTAALQTFLRSDGVTLLAAVDNLGDFITYDDGGTNGLAGIYAGTTPAVGLRAILAAGSAATTVLGLKQATSQSADLLATYDPSGTKIATIIDSTGNLVGGVGSVPVILNASSGFLLEGQDAGTTRMAIDYLGDILTYDNAGTTAMANIAGGTTPGAGYRVSLSTGASSIVGLGIKLAASQSVNALEIRNSAGTLLNGFDNAGNLIAGGGSVPTPPAIYGDILYSDGTGTSGGMFWSSFPPLVTSFNGRTGAISLNFTDCANAVSPSGFVNATGVAFGKVLTADGAGGYFWG